MKTLLKKTIITITLLVASAVISGNLFAEKRWYMLDPDKRAEFLTQRMDDSVSLSDKQKKSVFNLNLHNSETLKNIVQDDSTTPQKVKAVKTMYKTKRKEMEGLLTETQFKKYKKIEKETLQRALREIQRTR